MGAPNIIFLHSHNTGRYVEPYGHAIPSPNLMRLAREGVTFKQAYCASPTCSPSRASFLTGTWPHVCGMYGLGHRGFEMADYGLHLARYLKDAGYTTVLSGVDHTAPNIEMVGYDRILSRDDTNYPDEEANQTPAEAAAEYIRTQPTDRFFLSIGLNETHRPFPGADPARYPAEDPRYTAPVRPFPDTQVTRADAADLKAAVREMDTGYGSVLDALDESGLAGDTYVFCFTDHGLQFPRNMCNLTAHGTGVYLIVRGPEHFSPGTVSDALVSLIDLYPTVCDLVGIEIPDHVTGKSLCPLVDGNIDEVHTHVFHEINYHAAYEPTRAVRTSRYVYIRRFDRRERLVLPNVDDTSSKEFLLSTEWEAQPREDEMLFDRMFDPDEVNNVATRTDMKPVLDELSRELDDWMSGTGDPLLAGPAPAPPGARVNDADGRSPKDAPAVME